MYKLDECIRKNKINRSNAREAIYRVLRNADNCLSVWDITQRLNENYHKKISLNTIYRHLTLFLECELAIIIQDDYKKAYYTLTKEKALVFSLCPKCNNVSIIKDTSYFESMLIKLNNSEFLTIHQRCKRCR